MRRTGNRAPALQRAAEGRRGVERSGAIERRGMERVAAWQSSRHRCGWQAMVSPDKQPKRSSQWNTRGRSDEPDGRAPTDPGPEPARHQGSPIGLSAG